MKSIFLRSIWNQFFWGLVELTSRKENMLNSRRVTRKQGKWEYLSPTHFFKGFQENKWKHYTVVKYHKWSQYTVVKCKTAHVLMGNMEIWKQKINEESTRWWNVKQHMFNGEHGNLEAQNKGIMERWNKEDTKHMQFTYNAHSKNARHISHIYAKWILLQWKTVHVRQKSHIERESMWATRVI